MPKSEGEPYPPPSASLQAGTIQSHNAAEVMAPGQNVVQIRHRLHPHWSGEQRKQAQKKTAGERRSSQMNSHARMPPRLMPAHGGRNYANQVRHGQDDETADQIILIFQATHVVCVTPRGQSGGRLGVKCLPISRRPLPKATGVHVQASASYICSPTHRWGRSRTCQWAGWTECPPCTCGVTAKPLRSSTSRKKGQRAESLYKPCICDIYN